MLRSLGVAVAVSACSALANGQTMFEAHMHEVPAAQHPLGASGTAKLTLSPDQKRLAYTLEFNGLDLDPVAANRVDAEDVVGIHLHFIVPGVTGPHILNIFGTPAEEDADLSVDFLNEKLSGVFDISDATIDPATGEPLPQFFFITTKIIDDWIEALLSDQLYLAVHTVGENGGPLLHGDVVLVPEPATAGLLAAVLAAMLIMRKHVS